MIPVPMYLMKNTTTIEEKENTIKLSYLCDCGNDSFTVFQNSATKEEKALLRPFVYGIDENGKCRKIFDYETA